MPRSTWKGVVSFGMVSLPVNLFTATESKSIAFHQLHGKCKTRIKQQRWCPHCEQVVDWDDIKKGYEYSKGHYVILTEKELESLPLPSQHNIAVSTFVPNDSIDPVYHESSYYIEPDEAAERPFALFLKALQSTKTIAVAKIALRTKERLCAIRPVGNALLLETLYDADEIRQQPAHAKFDVSDKELGMAKHLIDLMSEDFEPQNYTDHYREALSKLIEEKLAGEEIAAPASVSYPGGKIVDLMEALRASVEGAEGKGSGARKKGAKASGRSTAAAEKSGTKKTARVSASARTRTKKTSAKTTKGKKTKRSA